MIEKIPLIGAVIFIINFKKIRRIWQIFFSILNVETETQIILTLIDARLGAEWSSTASRASHARSASRQAA